MDWGKTKTTLIILLLGLNIVLAVLFLYNKNIKTPYDVSNKTIEELVLRLEKNGIKLEGEIPKTPKNTRPLIVKYEEENPSDLNHRFFFGEGETNYNADISKITSGKEEVTIINNRRLLYENLGKIENIGKEIKMDIALDFLKTRGYSTEDLFQKKFVVNGDFGEIEFAKTYNDKVVETSYTRLILEYGQVVTMDRLWIDIVQEESGNIEIEPAYKALFSLLGRDDLKGKTIESIDMCYYFNPEEQGILEDNTRAEKGRAIPAWRIGFKGGGFLIVDNY